MGERSPDSFNSLASPNGGKYKKLENTAPSVKMLGEQDYEDQDQDKRKYCYDNYENKKLRDSAEAERRIRQDREANIPRVEYEATKEVPNKIKTTSIKAWLIIITFALGFFTLSFMAFWDRRSINTLTKEIHVLSEQMGNVSVEMNRTRNFEVRNYKKISTLENLVDGTIKNISTLQENQKEIQKSIKTIEEQMNNMTKTVEELIKWRNTTNGTLEDYKKKLDKLSEGLRNIQNNISFINDDGNILEHKLEKIESRIDKTDGRINDTEISLKGVRKTVTNMSDEFHNFKKITYEYAMQAHTDAVVEALKAEEMAKNNSADIKRLMANKKIMDDKIAELKTDRNITKELEKAGLKGLEDYLKNNTRFAEKTSEKLNSKIVNLEKKNKALENKIASLTKFKAASDVLRVNVSGRLERLENRTFGTSESFKMAANVFTIMSNVAIAFVIYLATTTM